MRPCFYLFHRRNNYGRSPLNVIQKFTHLFNKGDPSKEPGNQHKVSQKAHRISQDSRTEVLAALETRDGGLSEQEAEERLLLWAECYR